MKNLSIQWKIYIPSVALSVLAIGIMLFFFFSSIDKIENGVLLEKEKEFKTIVSEKLNSKTQVGLLSAINLAENRFIIQSLNQNDKSIAQKELVRLVNISKDASDYKNIKIHIHTTDVKSFLRHWNNKSGDDLSGFRQTILKVKESKKPLAGIEVGKSGLALRGLAPIFDGKTYIGSVEFIQSFESIVKDMKKDAHIDVVISIKKSLLNVAESLKDAPQIISNSYVVAQDIKNANEKLIQELSSVKEKDTQRSFSTKSYFVSKLPLLDFKGEEIGYIFIADKNEHVFEDIKTAESGMITQMIVVAIAIALLILTLMTIMKFYIINPINELKDYANDLAMGDGDLTKELPIKGDDEIGKTSYEFNQFIRKVRQTVSLAKDASSENASISNELSSTAKMVEKSVEETSQIIKNTFDMSNSMKDEIQASIKNVTETSTILTQTTNKLSDAKNKISQITNMIQDTSVNETELANHIKLLESNTQEVKSVLSVISDIADQTNLLALNAAIEAARAGEQGRGFAVVADEVRKLAERTQDSLNEINVTISTINNSMSEATDKMQRNVESIQNLTHIAQETMDSVDEVSISMTQTKNQSQQSANDFNKTAKQINELLSKIEHINDISSVNMRNTEEIAKAAKHLENTGEKINQVLIKFRT